MSTLWYKNLKIKLLYKLPDNHFALKCGGDLDKLDGTKDYTLMIRFLNNNSIVSRDNILELITLLDYCELLKYYREIFNMLPETSKVRFIDSVAVEIITAYGLDETINQVLAGRYRITLDTLSVPPRYKELLSRCGTNFKILNELS